MILPAFVAVAAATVALLPFDSLASRLVYHGVEVVWVAGMVVGIRLHRPGRARRVWWLLAAAYGTSVLGEIVKWLVDPDPAIALSFTAYLLGVFAYVSLLRARTGRGDLPGLLDAGIFSTCAAMGAWLIFVHPLLAGGRISGDDAVILVYPVLDLFLLFLLLRLVLAPGSALRALRLVMASVAVLLVADVGSLLHGGSTPLLRSMWMVAMGIVTLAALHPSMVAIADVARAPQGRLSRGWRFVLLGIAAASGPIVLVFLALMERNGLMPPVAVSTLVMLALVFARMWHALREADEARDRSEGLLADLRTSEHRFRSLVQYAAEGVVVVNDVGEVTYVSPTVERLTGYTCEDLLGDDGFQFIVPEELRRAAEIAAQALAAPGEHFTNEIRARHRDGSPRTFEVTITNLLDDPGVSGLVANLRDVTESKALADQLHQQAFYDVLTGLANRALLWDRLEKTLIRCRSRSGPAALLLVDVDDFKGVNDNYGHEAGDLFLQEFARRLERCLRSGDTAARLGGDEFALLLEDVRTDEEARAAATRLLTALAQPFDVGGREISGSASIGIAITEGEDGDAESWMRRADLAMYEAKRDPDTSVALYADAMHDAAVSRTTLRAELARALERDELVCHYQPIMEVADGTISGVEALVRWEHPERGLLSPFEFVPIAEESGLIRPLGAWVLEAACGQLARWLDMTDGAPLTLHVNVSPQQLADPSFVATVAEAVTRHALPAGALALEITETCLMESGEGMIARLGELRNVGVELAIDDFGTGYSSLRYLQKFPVDVLKIDRGFVAGLTEGPESAAVAHAIIKLAHILRLQTVAEGVETQAQLDRLAELGCDRAQGYLFHRPLPADVLTALLSPVAQGLPEPRAVSGGIVGR